MAQGSINRKASKHYAIDGVYIQSPSLEESISKDIIISRSFNNILGVIVDKPLRYRRQFTWKYKAISQELLTEIYTNIIMKHIIETGSRFFNITTFYPGQGENTIYCYLGTPIDFKPIVSNETDAVLLWDLTLTWTEVEGIGLGGVSSG